MNRWMLWAMLATVGCDEVRVARTPNGPAVTLGATPQPQCQNRECGDDRAGGVCGACTAGFACDGQGRCQMQAAVWSIVVESAQITPRDVNDNNATWDPEGGAPDPQVCAIVGTQRACSAVAQETLSPVWNLTVGSFAPADLMRGVVLNMDDVDSLANDSITRCSWTPTREFFRTGTSVVRCPGTNITVRARPL